MKSVVLAIFLLSLPGIAAAVPVELVDHNQRTGSGTLSTLVWETGAAQGCPGPTFTAPCYNPATGFLTQTGTLWTASFVNSNPSSSAVISDKVVVPDDTATGGNLTISSTGTPPILVIP